MNRNSSKGFESIFDTRNDKLEFSNSGSELNVMILFDSNNDFIKNMKYII